VRRILVTTAVAALVAGFVLGSSDPAEGRNTPAIKATPGGECGTSSGLSMESCPCKETAPNWQAPYKSRRAPDMDRKHLHGPFAARIMARTWWWNAVWPR
jgi:hypothetical protein